MMGSIALDTSWQLSRDQAEWHDAQVPGTVGSALQPDLDAGADYDACDWWYRTTFAAPARGRRQWLRFEGLATLAQVWLNGEPILSSRNMFVGHRVEVTGLLRDVNQLLVRFESLGAALAAKRPRPRWKTALVEAQNLRWFRTTLLGRMPGWNPRVAPVGPWRPVRLEWSEGVDVASLELQPSARDGRGHLAVRAAITTLDGACVAEARVRVGERGHALAILQGHDARIHGDLDLGAVPLWYPHTHGEPRRLPCALEFRVDDEWHEVDAGSLGFREIALDRDEGRVALRVNGVPIFCRGTVWTTADILRIDAPRERLRERLVQAREAGANMLRVGGTMAYESDDFYALCDELGLLVWQDFMFANMDYPLDDAVFRAEAEAEVAHQLSRLRPHACVAVYCGGSEISQQAAMLGLDARHWSHEFFDEALPTLVATHHPGVPCFPSTPWGGALPFHVGTGIAHYYGVGAYRRPLDDVRMARVRFAAECLAFANLPEPEAARDLMGRESPATHHPRWKARVPRDNDAGWDFEDVRDHYLREMAGVDPVALRSHDPARYHALSRIVSGEVMRRAYAHWRSPASGCGGALVWNHQDPWLGAGWGIVDAQGAPKPAYWALRRAWAPCAVHLVDEGLDGFAVHVCNDRAEPLAGSVEIALLRDANVVTAHGESAITLGGHEAATLRADAILGRFTDCSYAYRFGPRSHDLVVATLRDAGGAVISEDFVFLAGLALPARTAELEASAEWLDGERVRVVLRAPGFLQAVRVASPGFAPDDNYFHLAPGREKAIVFRQTSGDAAFRATFSPLNAPRGVEVSLDPAPAARGASRRGAPAAGPARTCGPRPE